MISSHYRTKWNEMEMKSKEMGHQLLQRLALTFKAWTKGTDDLEDMMVREKYLTLLPTAVQTWVKTQNPSTAEKAAQLADDFILSQPKVAEPPKRWTPSRPERSWNSGPRPAVKTEPASKPEVPKLPSFDLVKGPRCYHCQEFGHVAAKCPKKTCLVSVANPITDFIVYPGNVEGQEVSRILVDTDSNISQVHSRWLPDNYVQQGTLEIQGPNHGSTKYPRTTITWKSRVRRLRRL